MSEDLKHGKKIEADDTEGNKNNRVEADKAQHVEADDTEGNVRYKDADRMHGKH